MERVLGIYVVGIIAGSYTPLRAHETSIYLEFRLLLEKNTYKHLRDQETESYIICHLLLLKKTIIS
ncbi:hypothetical protein, partial [Enterobacter hormaechei]|uniref:hypothetical protein n=1 Tax=Enterobacter hormaechei TaxID=158836 RepID=UPI001EEE2197